MRTRLSTLAFLLALLLPPLAGQEQEPRRIELPPLDLGNQRLPAARDGSAAERTGGATTVPEDALGPIPDAGPGLSSDELWVREEEIRAADKEARKALERSRKGTPPWLQAVMVVTVAVLGIGLLVIGALRVQREREARGGRRH